MLRHGSNSQQIEAQINEVENDNTVVGALFFIIQIIEEYN